ncbi:MAG TPA: hypothetical protein PKO06_19820 [Candidatus Ozemobacteraceae bacterium]|nr:hypothetical protein [Candidatus Ozemobacteraceae bacterium]
MFAPLLGFLQDRRDSLNETFFRLRQQYPGLEQTVGYELVRLVIDPLWQSVDGKESEGALLQAAQIWYELGLELAGRGFGPSGHTSAFWPAWLRLGRAYPALVIRQPRPFLIALANALWQLQSTGQPAVERWLGTLENLTDLGNDLSTWMQAGTLTAWRCGLATQRKRALAEARKLSPALGLACLGLSRDLDSAQWLALVERLTIDPWYDPEFDSSWKQRNPTLIGTVGRFRGLGGEFARPPRVRIWNDVVLAGVEQEWFVVHADVYGTCLQRVTVDLPAETTTLVEPWKLAGGGVVTRQGQQSVIPELGHCAGVAATRDLLVAALHHSHRLFLVV